MPNGYRRGLFCRAIAALMLVAPSLSVPLNAAPNESRREEKFHLVYLVSVIDLRPKSKAFVDPVFFTDGNRVKSFFDYCRVYGKQQEASITDLKPAQIGDPLEPIQRYCENRSLMLDGKQYHTLNNSGVTVRLGTIEFAPGVKHGTRDGHAVIPSTRPYPGVTTIEDVVGTRPAIELDADSAKRPRHFFLMSADKIFLERLVPVQRYHPAEMQALVRRARAYAEEVKGEKRGQWSSLVDGQIQTNVSERKRPTAFNVKTKPLVLDALFADLDGDNIPDAVVGAAAVWGNAPDTFRWQGELHLLSKAGNWFTAGHRGGGDYEGQLAHGYAHGPRALLKVGPCLYLLTAGSHGATYGLRSEPRPSKSCLPLMIDREVGLFGEMP